MPADPLELISVEIRSDLAALETSMAGATTIVDQNVARITQSVDRAEQSIRRSSEGMGEAMDNTSNSSRMMAMQFSQMGQQVAAGGSILQSIAIQLPDLALALGSTGTEAGALASFFGGPWGIALTTAAAVAAAFIPQILGMGDAADKAKPKIDALTAAIDRLRNEQGTLGDMGQAEAKIGKLQSDLLKLSMDTSGNRGGALQRAARRKEIMGEIEDLQQLVRWQQAVDKSHAAQAATPTRSSPTRSSTPRSAGKSDAERAAEADDRRSKVLDQQYARTRSQLELEGQLADIRAAGTDEANRQADIMEAQSRLEAQFPDLDKARLKVLQDIAAVNINHAYDLKADKDALDAFFDELERGQKARADAADKLQQKQEAQVRTLAGLYEDAFRGGTKAIWQDFKSMGLRVVAEVLARFTMAQLGGGSFNLGSAISSAIGSVLPGFASGGSMVIGGTGGVDKNVLSLNGAPIAKVSQGETLHVSNPSLARGASGNTAPLQIIQVDARGAVMNDQFAAQILAQARAFDAQMGAFVSRGVLKSMPGRLASYQRDGT